ncbi:MAG: preprotein translocase subunit SecE, partial [Erysipelotrichaceae bacterium]|nr:preprotein translocase subunit SecE [Erysipelotrichaceae bacterium]
FNIVGIQSEIRRIRWPKLSDLTKNSFIVIMFTVAFGLFFVVCELIASGFLTIVGF